MSDEKTAEQEHGRAMTALLFTVRYMIPAIIVAFGFIWAVSGLPFGWEAFCLFTGAGLSSALLNALYRIGVQGEAERDEEVAAREYHTRHGHWPDEAPTA
jgi:hypothetical protein